MGIISLILVINIALLIFAISKKTKFSSYITLFSIFLISCFIIFTILAAIDIDVVLTIVSLVCSFIISYKLFPTLKKAFNINYNFDEYDLIGSVAVAETKITQEFGVATILESKKRVVCKTYREDILTGQRILLTDFDPKTSLYMADLFPYVV